jgi:F-type H+-transporting ATPase subunit alpha
VPTNKIVEAEKAILQHVDRKIYKVLRAAGKISPELNEHLATELRKVPLPA